MAGPFNATVTNTERLGESSRVWRTFVYVPAQSHRLSACSACSVEASVPATHTVHASATAFMRVDFAIAIHRLGQLSNLDSGAMQRGAWLLPMVANARTHCYALHVALLQLLPVYCWLLPMHGDCPWRLFMAANACAQCYALSILHI